MDGLGINTDMRVRPLNSFDHPLKVFSEIVQPDKNAGFSLFTIMRSSKFKSFPTESQKLALNSGLKHKNEHIKDPDNAGKKIAVEIFSFTSS